MKLWIDDEREPPHDWDWAQTYLEALCAIAVGVAEKSLEAISFDHDLGGYITGYDLACVVERLAASGAMNWYRGELRCHSANPVGRKRIEQVCKATQAMIGYH